MIELAIMVDQEIDPICNVRPFTRAPFTKKMIFSGNAMSDGDHKEIGVIAICNP